MAQQVSTVVFGALVPAGFALARGESVAATADLVYVLSAIVAVGAGVASLICWKILGFARYGWRGSALTVLGLLTLAGDSVPQLGIGQLVPSPPLSRLVICLLVIALLAQALRGREVDARLAPLQVTAGATCVGLFLLGALSLLARHGSLPAALLTVHGQVRAEDALASAWIALAVATWLRRPAGAPLGWGVPVVVLLGAGEAATALGLAGPSAYLLVGAICSLVGLAIACVDGVGDLSFVLGAQDRYTFRLRLDLDTAHVEMEEEQRRLDERLHDLRNAVTAVRTADLALRRYKSHLDEHTSASLADAISSELARLQTLIEPSVRPAVDFSVAGALAPLVATEQTLGPRIQWQLGDLRAHGDPAALAQVVQNLLVNARRYAPGSPVVVDGTQRGGRVLLRVRDRGPGIVDAERLTIFGRGTRGTAGVGTSGTGLGLYVAAQLLASMGGTIHVGSTETPGACLVVELPVAQEPCDGAAWEPGAPVLEAHRDQDPVS